LRGSKYERRELSVVESLLSERELKVERLGSKTTVQIWTLDQNSRSKKKGRGKEMSLETAWITEARIFCLL